MMKFHIKNKHKKEKQKNKNADKLIIKCGENDVRVYPKGTLINMNLEHEK